MPMNWLPRAKRRLIQIISANPLAAISSAFLAGVLAWGGFNWSLEITNTQSFCISCHEMREYVYPEYQATIHFANGSGIRASCPDCHVPRDWVHKVARKVGATNELFHWMARSISTREKFEAKRGELAEHVWVAMKATDSRECRNCHEMGTMAHEVQSPNAQLMHALSDGWGMTCIDCHQGVAHELPRGFDRTALMDELHERLEAENVECRVCHEDIVAPPPGQEW